MIWNKNNQYFHLLCVRVCVCKHKHIKSCVQTRKIMIFYKRTAQATKVERDERVENKERIELCVGG